MEKKVLLADDERPARNLLKEYLSDYPQLQLIGECRNGIEAVSLINVLQPDIVFLDIQMPAKTGFEVLQELEYIPLIIFSTAYDKYALQAFEVNAVDYLLKPYTRERFRLAIERALSDSKQAMQNIQLLSETLQQKMFPERILVEQGNRLISLAVADIQWIEAEGDYSKIHTAEHSYLSNRGISALEQKLDPRKFQRIHRSYLVALGSIKEVFKEPTGPQVVLLNGTTLKVSRSYVEALRKLIL